MTNTNMAFILTILAGLSTMIGTIFIFIKPKNTNKIISSSLAFASGVMITVSVEDLIPEAINHLRNSLTDINIIIITILGILLGIIISMLIDYYLPNNTKEEKNKLYRVGFMLVVAIVLHNIPEGIATFIATKSNITLGLSLSLAIAMHNIPEGISISVPIYYSTKSKKKALLYTGISALSEPLGALLAYIFLKNIINDLILGIIFSVVAGIMLQISFCELLPTSKKYKESTNIYIYLIAGIIFMLLKNII